MMPMTVKMFTLIFVSPLQVVLRGEMEDSAELQAIDQILSSEGPQAVFNDR